MPMISMSEVARRAGVSRSAVSLVLNGRADESRISGETQRRIEEMASELGYRPNALARAIVSGQSKSVGFLTEEADNGVEFKARILSGILAEANEAGYSVKVLHLSHERAGSDVIERCLEWRLAGLVATSVHHDSLALLRDGLKRHGVAVALVEDNVPRDCDLCVASDEKSGIAAALDHLHELGHRRIAFIGGSDDVVSRTRAANMASAACQRGFALCGGEDGTFWGSWWDVDINTRAAHELLDGAPDATAVLCAGDPSAVALLNVARQRGLTVPRDLSIIGFGNHSFARYCDPMLSTIAQPFDEIGRQGARALFDFLEARANPSARGADVLSVESPASNTNLQAHSPIPEIMLPTHLVLRGTTSPLAKLNSFS